MGKYQPFGFALSFACMFFAFFIKLDDVESSHLILRISFLVIALLYSLRYVQKQKKVFVDTVKFLLISFWCILNVGFTLNATFDPMVFYAFFIVGVIWLFFELKAMSQAKQGFLKNFMVLGAALFAIEVVLRIKRMPFASIIHLWAIFILFASFTSEGIKRLRNGK